MKTEQTSTPASKNVKNGAETPKTDLSPAVEPAKVDAVKSDAASDADSDEKKTGGAVPLMPSAVVYKLDGKVYACIHHPVDGTSYVQSGKGIGAAKGALEDAGFPLGTLIAKGPNWIAAKVPAGATVLGFAHLKGFPLPAQD